jgi:adenylyltransferase/sulfurtransferase
MREADSIPRDKEVIFYCKMGIRSQIAIQRLQERFGFTNLVNLQGGMEAWKKELNIST